MSEELILARLQTESLELAERLSHAQTPEEIDCYERSLRLVASSSAIAALCLRQRDLLREIEARLLALEGSFRRWKLPPPDEWQR